MTVIDLGELHEEPPPRTRPRPRPRRRAGRPLWVLSALVLLLATVAAAAPPAGRIAAVVPGAGLAEAFLAGDLLLVAGPAQAVTDRSQDLTAYRLPERATGTAQRPEPVWRIRLPVVGELWRVQAGDGVVVLSVSLPEDGVDETVVLEAASGRVRWRLPGVPRSDVTGRVLLETVGGRPLVQSVDVATGRTLWSAPSMPPGTLYGMRDGVVDRVVLVRPDGHVEVRDAATGAVLRTADLPRQGFGEQRSQVVGDLLLVFEDGETGRVAAYGVDRLDLRWRAEVPLATYLVECGELLCSHAHAGGLQAIDPATGVARWRTPGWGVLLAVRSGRLLVAGTETRGDTFAVLDAGTGRAVAELGRWVPVPSTDADGPLVGLRLAGNGQLVVAELDVVAARARIMEVVTGAAGNCQVSTEVLLCRRLDGTFGVWRWRG